jgi:hypothetical protein
VKAEARHKGLLKEGTIVVLQAQATEVRATVLRGEVYGRPVLLRNEFGALMTAFPTSLSPIKAAPG